VAAIGAVESRIAATLMVAKTDRVARSLRTQLAVVDRVERGGAVVVAADGSIDTSTAADAPDELTPPLRRAVRARTSTATQAEQIGQCAGGGEQSGGTGVGEEPGQGSKCSARTFANLRLRFKPLAEKCKRI